MESCAESVCGVAELIRKVINNSIRKIRNDKHNELAYL